LQIETGNSCYKALNIIIKLYLIQFYKLSVENAIVVSDLAQESFDVHSYNKFCHALNICI